MNPVVPIVAGVVVLVLDIVLTTIWTKNYSSSKIFYNNPEVVALLFSLGSFIAAVYFKIAHKAFKKNKWLFAAVVICLLLGIAGIAIAFFIRATSNLFSY
ncbi:hypothetical protein KW794_02575 [Candidatus Saccharibacteria bacterium]|nr:hypothetical protein [Candidatus Saccharibacteria bacterium]